MGGSSPSTVTQTSKVELSPEQKALFDLGEPYLKQYASTPLQQFSGSGIAQLTPEELQAQQLYKNAAAGNITNLSGQAAGTQQMLLDPNFMLDVASNPYLQAAKQATANQVTQNLTENQLPAIRTGSTQAGGMYSGGGSRQGIAEGLAIGRTNQGLASAESQADLQAYQQGQQGLERAIAANPSVEAQQLLPADVLAATGAQTRAQEQALLDEQIRNFYTAQQLPLLQGKDIINAASGLPGATAVGTATGNVPKANPLLQGGGLLASLLGLFA